MLKNPYGIHEFDNTLSATYIYKNNERHEDEDEFLIKSRKFESCICRTTAGQREIHVKETTFVNSGVFFILSCFICKKC